MIGEDAHVLEKFLDGVANGTIRIAQNLDLARLTGAIKFDEKGNIDPSTVAPEVLSAARMFSALDQRRAMKQLPLEKLQGAYFDILESCFGELASVAAKNGFSAGQIGRFLASRGDLVSEFDSNYEELLSLLTEYWRDTNDVGVVHVQDVEGITLAYHGSLVPGRAMINAAALTAGTIIVPDPLMKLLTMHPHADKEASIARVLRCGIEMLKYRVLATEHLQIPLLVVTADRLEVDPRGTNYLEAAADEGLVGIAGELFAARFSEAAEVGEFLGRITSIEELASLVRNPELVLFEEDGPEDLFVRLSQGLHQTTRYLPHLLERANPGELLMFHLRSRTLQAADALYKAQTYGALPYMDAPVSWQHFQWFLEHTSEIPREGSNSFAQAPISPEAFQKIPGFLDLPAEALIRLYREGVLDRIRGEVFAGLELWAADGEKDPAAVMRAISGNISRAISEYGVLVEEESRAVSGMASSSLLLTGNVLLALAAAVPGPSTANLISAAAGLIGMKNFADVSTSISRVISAKKELRRSAIGALFKVDK